MKIEEGNRVTKEYLCAEMTRFFVCIFLLIILQPPCTEAQTDSLNAPLSSTELCGKSLSNMLIHHPMLMEKQAEAGRMIVRPSENRTNVFLISLALLFVFAGFRISHHRHISQLFTFMTKSEGGNRSVKERLSSSEHISWLFVAVYLLGLAYILYNVILIKGNNNLVDPGFHLLPICIAACLGYFFIKQMLQKWVAWTFMQTARLDEYRLSLSWVLEISAIIIFPLCIALVMSSGRVHQWLLYSGVAFVLVITLFRYIRMMAILKKLVALNFIYFFIYICAFEILPVAALFKLLFNKVSN